jgi:hypothetical protein
MKTLMLYLVGGLVVVVLAFGLANHLDPTVRAERQHRAYLAQQQRMELAPLVLTIKRIGLGSLAVACVSLAIALSWSALLYLPARARRAAVLAWSKYGLPPWIIQEASRWKVTGPEGRNLSAETARAVFAGAEHQGADGPRITSPVMRQLLNPPSPEEALLPDEALELPAHASIYTAPIDGTLALPIGMSGDGPVALPLRDLGGGVIGGLQGLGKSELVASMMVGLLRQDASGQSVRLALADMKGGLDFGRVPGDLPALQWPIATDEEAAVVLAAQLWQEIQRRQDLLRRAGCASLENYNDARSGERLPYIVAFVDELMMLTAPSLEAGVSRIGRRSSQEFIGSAVRSLAVGRATGVSLIMATQRPSGDVVPTRLRDLAGFRIAYHCATVEASRAVLGQSGAEALPHDPGQAILVRGEAPIRLRTYDAGIRAGQFDGFLRRLPRAPRLDLPVDAEADGLGADDRPDTIDTTNTAYTTGIGGMRGPQRAFACNTACNTARSTTVTIPADASMASLSHDQRQAIWDAWKLSQAGGRASLRGTEAILWPNIEHGGDKFYVVREVVRAELAKRGLWV